MWSADVQKGRNAVLISCQKSIPSKGKTVPLSVSQKFETVSKAMLGNLARDEVEITKGLP